MSGNSFVNRFVSGIEDGTIFTTRDLLPFGSRASIDQALHRLIKAGQITRLARGIFLKTRGEPRKVDIREIAEAKTASLGQKLVQDHSHRAESLGLPPIGLQKHRFFTNGSAISFTAYTPDGEIRIQIEQASLRHIALGESTTGLLVRRFSRLGKNAWLEYIKTMPGWLSITQAKDEMRKRFASMPSWMSDSLLSTSSRESSPTANRRNRIY